MLHFETVSPTALELLRSLQQIAIFKDLRLVGGTSLALQYGHRKSIDIDLFGLFEADELEMTEDLSRLGQIKQLQKSKNIFVYLINGIKTDIVRYKYPWLEDIQIIDGIRFAGRKDIAAMKLAAITGRGTKKDFIDIWFLLKEFSLQQMMGFYLTKYSDGTEFLVLKSLGYFTDADNDPKPVMLSDVEWVHIKDGIKSALTNYLR